MSSQGARFTFAYDAFGDRVARRDSRGTTYFLQHERHLIEEIGENGASTAFYVYGPGMDRPLAVLRDGQTYFYHADALGSIAPVTDGNGQVAASYETDAFGRLLGPPPQFPNPFIFAGREYEPALELCFERDPALGQFLSPDPLAGTPDDPASYNRYAYAANAPTRYTDPLGLKTEKVNPLASKPAGDTLKGMIAAPKPRGSAVDPSIPEPYRPQQEIRAGKQHDVVRVRPDPSFRITDHEGMGLPKETIDRLVAETKRRIVRDPEYVSEGGLDAAEWEYTRHDLGDYHYNKGGSAVRRPAHRGRQCHRRACDRIEQRR